MLDPGQVAFWTGDPGIDVEDPVEIDELDLIPIDPLPSYDWPPSEPVLAGTGSVQTIQAPDHEHYPELISSWHALRDVRAERRAVGWLLEEGLVDDGAAQQFVAGHPDPGFS